MCLNCKSTIALVVVGSLAFIMFMGYLKHQSRSTSTDVTHGVQNVSSKTLSRKERMIIHRIIFETRQDIIDRRSVIVRCCGFGSCSNVPKRRKKKIIIKKRKRTTKPASGNSTTDEEEEVTTPSSEEETTGGEETTSADGETTVGEESTGGSEETPSEESTTVEGETTVADNSTTVHDANGTTVANITTPLPNATTLHSNTTTPHLNTTTPHLNATTTHLNSTTPHVNATTLHFNGTTPHPNSTTTLHSNSSTLLQNTTTTTPTTTTTTTTSTTTTSLTTTQFDLCNVDNCLPIDCSNPVANASTTEWLMMEVLRGAPIPPDMFFTTQESCNKVYKIISGSAVGDYEDAFRVCCMLKMKVLRLESAEKINCVSNMLRTMGQRPWVVWTSARQRSCVNSTYHWCPSTSTPVNSSLWSPGFPKNNNIFSQTPSPNCGTLNLAYNNSVPVTTFENTPCDLLNSIVCEG